MKRVVVAAVLLAVAAGVTVWCGYVFDREMDYYEKELNRLIDISSASTDEKLIEEATKLVRIWDDSSVLLRSVVLHGGIDELGRSISSLPQLIKISGKEEMQKKCADAAVEIAHAIEDELWMPRAGHYKVGIYKYFKFPSDIFSWKKYYPCATAQLFPIIHGLIDPNTERANNLYDKFCENYDWANFEYDDVFYWGANLQAAVYMNDIEQVVVYMENYENFIDTHDYPLYNADAARVCLAANMLLEKYG